MEERQHHVLNQPPERQRQQHSGGVDAAVVDNKEKERVLDVQNETEA